jgi:hypothetical protein
MGLHARSDMLPDNIVIIGVSLVVEVTDSRFIGLGSDFLADVHVRIGNAPYRGYMFV